MTADQTAIRCKPVFGSRDPVTGHRSLTWNTDTILNPVNIIGRGMTGFHTPAGYTGKIDYVMQCADPVQEGEHVIWNNMRFHIEYFKPEYQFDNFLYRDCALTYLPFYEESAAQASWPASQVDARQKVKEYLDARITVANLTKNDGVTLASTVNMFELKLYPMRYEFRASSSPVQGIYAVSQPESTPMLGASASPRGYDENVPIHILTVDSKDCAGELLQRKMENELRTVTETYEIGSRCNLTNRRDNSRSLGSMWLFDVTWNLKYQREPT